MIPVSKYIIYVLPASRDQIPLSKILQVHMMKNFSGAQF